MKTLLPNVLFAGMLAMPVAMLAADDAKKDQPLPLKPTRNVEFTTDQGSWLSLDVSPDGKTILFELVGDLYTVPFTGGEAHKLTTGMAFNSQPRYSPDGKKITFITDRGGAENVWTADADGSNAKQLSQDDQSEFASPVWTPDGNYVIASRFTQFPIGASELGCITSRVALACRSPSRTPNQIRRPGGGSMRSARPSPKMGASFTTLLARPPRDFTMWFFLSPRSPAAI